MSNQLKVTSRKIEISEFEDQDTLYCIKNGQDHIFTLERYSWSLSARNGQQVEDFMSMENGMVGQEPLKTIMISEMKEMITELSPIKDMVHERE